MVLLRVVFVPVAVARVDFERVVALGFVFFWPQVIPWAFAQSPYLLPGKLTIRQAIAPSGTQDLLLAVTAGVIFLVAPAMGLLYYLDQKNTLESPGA